MTSAPAMNAAATGTGANSRALIAPPKASPSTAAGRNAISEIQHEALRAALARQPARDGEKPGAIFPADGDDGAGLDDDLE